MTDSPNSLWNVSITEPTPELVLSLILPGFVFTQVLSLLRPSADRDLKDKAFEIVSFGVINYLFIFLPINYVLLSYDGKWLKLATYILSFVGGPIFLCLAYIWVTNELNKRGIALHSAPTAWDNYFIRKEKCWVKVYLKNGKVLFGKYGDGSAVSLFPSEPAIYVSEMFHGEKNGAFGAKVKQTKGFWIRGEEIQFLEFFEAKKPKEG